MTRAMMLVFTVVLAALASPTLAQEAGRGVACVYASLPADVRTRLLAAYSRDELSAAELEPVRIAMQPAVQSCTSTEGWTLREQQEASFAYALNTADLVVAGSALQGAGVDPRQVAALFPALPAGTADRLARTDQLSDAETEQLVATLRQFLSTNGPARQPPARGLAFEFLMVMAKLEATQARFDAAR